MIFTIRNQNGKWKIHSEGEKRTDQGSTVPLRNTAIKIAKNNNWKYCSVAVAGDEVHTEEQYYDIISQYVVSMESYKYGNETAYDISKELEYLQEKGLPDFYRCNVNTERNACSLAFIKKEKFIEYIEMFDNRPYDSSYGDCSKKNEAGKEDQQIDRNILLYGVPGAGKSYTIKNEYCNNPEYMERVVFHPDYSYADFVGQILPRVKDGKVKYVFEPGPFTKILKKAKNDSNNNNYYLIIEEINRGNAPAIFGDIFQLLDREDDITSNIEIGESTYGITNYDISKEVYGNENELIRIPSNLFIIATMNTSDQNVFTLDTAFQRRWKMRQIENDFKKASHANNIINGTNISWEVFATTINEVIVENNFNLSSSEDKRLGAYFVKVNDLSVEQFPEKVLKYLWDDAFKMDKEIVFNDELKTLENVINKYEKDNTDRLQAVLNPGLYKTMLEKMKNGSK